MDGSGGAEYSQNRACFWMDTFKTTPLFHNEHFKCDKHGPLSTFCSRPVPCPSPQRVIQITGTVYRRKGKRHDVSNSIHAAPSQRFTMSCSDDMHGSLDGRLSLIFADLYPQSEEWWVGGWAGLGWASVLQCRGCLQTCSSDDGWNCMGVAEKTKWVSA